MIATAGDRIHVVIYSESDLFSVSFPKPFPAFKNPVQSTSCRPLFWIWRHTKSGRDTSKLMVVIPITSDLSLPLALFYDLDILCCFFSVYFSFLPDRLSFCLIYAEYHTGFMSKYTCKFVCLSNECMPSRIYFHEAGNESGTPFTTSSRKKSINSSSFPANSE